MGLLCGKEGYLFNQGFYLYRNGRLISPYLVWYRKTPKTLQVRIDIDNKSDLFWQLDVKDSAVPPFGEKKIKSNALVSQPREISMTKQKD